MKKEDSIKLIEAVKELNIGMVTIVNFLAEKGYRIERQPMAKLTPQMYEELLQEFSVKKESDKPIKLIKAVKELNIGMGTIVDFLAEKGYRVEKQPMALLTQPMYDELLKQYSHNEHKVESVSPNSVIGKVRTESPKNFPDLYAVQLINDCLKKQSDTLDLGNCDLKSEHWHLNSELDKALRKCTHISTLILSNEFEEYNDKLSFPKLQYSSNPGPPNYLRDIPLAVRSLKQLRKLVCCGNPEARWGITSIQYLSNHEKLEYLDLSFNNISSLKDIKKLVSLETLVLHNNEIRVVNNIFKLPRLTLIDLNNNGIEKVYKFSNPTSITHLDLSHNKISEIGSLENFVDLEELNVRSNVLSDINDFIPLSTKSDKFFLAIDDNPLVNDFQLKLLPGENHYPFINEIIKRKLDGSEKVEVSYPVKILMFGNHSVGKSTLVNELTSTSAEGSTHILRIVNYKRSQDSSRILPDAVFFDFGGQDFYHGVYRAFISDNALQLILFNQRTDVNEISVDVNNIPIVNLNRSYWLGQKNYQEKNKTDKSPYILVQTHIDSVNSEPFAINLINYPGHLKTFDLALDTKASDGTGSSYRDFYQAGQIYFQVYLDTIIRKMQVANNEPLWYYEFLKFIIDREAKDHEATSVDTVLDHYVPIGLTIVERRKSLINNLTQLHRFGLILYYSDIAGLDNICWLNPQKLVEHIQMDLLGKAFADPKISKTPGVLPKDIFENVVKDKKIVLLLSAQNVIFLHDPTGNETDQEYIVPNFLPLSEADDKETELSMFGLEQANFIIKFNDFIPFGFINQMICFFGKLPDLKRFWRNRLLFTINRQVRVLIDLDFQQLKIKVIFQRLQRCEYSSNILTEYLFFCILGLYWNFSEKQLLNFNEFLLHQNGLREANEEIARKIVNWRELIFNEQYVPEDAYISLNDVEFVSYFNLRSLPHDVYNIDSYQIAHNKINTFKIRSIPIAPFEPFVNYTLPVMKKIFVSYSKFDEEYLQDFEDHLITLKREGVATFNCKKIEFGKEWDEEIKKQIDECDIMVCLISVKFLNTNYITDIEIPKAIEQGKLIIPIIIKACDWENSELGKYQAAQRGKIVSIDNSKRLFGETRAQTREERDVFWTDVIKEFRAKIDFVKS